MLMYKRLSAKWAIFAITTLFLATSIPLANADWPVYRSDAARTGLADSSGPLTPTSLWNFSAGTNAVGDSPAIVDGKLYEGKPYPFSFWDLHFNARFL
jgi:hypothetical protein